MATYSIVIASGSTDGKPIQITGTASGSQNTIHTAHATSIDEVTLYASNTHTAAVNLTVAVGTTATEGELIADAVPIEAGATLVPILIKHRITNSVTVTAFASTGSKINIIADINRIG